MERRKFLQMLGIGGAATVTCRVNANAPNVSNTPKAVQPEPQSDLWTIRVVDRNNDPLRDVQVHLVYPDHVPRVSSVQTVITNDEGKAYFEKEDCDCVVKVCEWNYLYVETPIRPDQDGAWILLEADRLVI